MKILITVNDQGGGVILWNYEEISPTLREQMKHHYPIVVLEKDEMDIPKRNTSQTGGDKAGNLPMLRTH